MKNQKINFSENLLNLLRLQNVNNLTCTIKIVTRSNPVMAVLLSSSKMHFPLLGDFQQAINQSQLTQSLPLYSSETSEGDWGDRRLLTFFRKRLTEGTLVMKWHVLRLTVHLLYYLAIHHWLPLYSSKTSHKSRSGIRIFLKRKNKITAKNVLGHLTTSAKTNDREPQFYTYFNWSKRYVLRLKGILLHHIAIALWSVMVPTSKTYSENTIRENK